MASDIKEAIRRMIYQYVVEGADKVMATQEAVAASTTTTDKASLSLEKTFGNLERRYVETVRHQQDYAKVQDKVNAAVAQNPALQERANAVLAAAGEHFDKLASKGNFFSELMVKGFTRFLGPAALVSTALTGIGAVIGIVTAQWEASHKTIEQILEEQNRLLKESTKLIDGKTSAQERMFAQSKDVLEYQNLRNEEQIRKKINEALERQIALIQQKPVTGEMGAEIPSGPGLVKDPGYEQIIAAQQQLQATIAQGLPAWRAYNDALARIGKAYPELRKQIDELLKDGFGAQQMEDAKLKAEAMDAALKGVATSAQLAALALKSVNENKIDQRSMAEAALAAERMADAMVALSEKYKGMTLDTAKQLELLEAQLNVARARTKEEELYAQQQKRILELKLQQGKSDEEALAIASKERQVAEENIQKQKAQQAAQASVTDEIDNSTNAVNRFGDGIGRAVTQTQHLYTWWKDLDSITYAVDHKMSMLATNTGARVTAGYDPLNTIAQKKGLEAAFGAENIKEVPLPGIGIYDYQGMMATVDFDKLAKERGSTTQDLINSLQQAAKSTDSLNATMQNALSPYYSQDPRTTKLGFRAGAVGNPDWLAPGASNANPLAALLGPGATVPGMANGGSFVVGGGYSANDNKIAAFPVASGEQVVVNRNPGGGARVVNIDNRIIVTGAVDGDALSKLKVSRYQQTQRMRAGLAQA